MSNRMPLFWLSLFATIILATDGGLLPSQYSLLDLESGQNMTDADQLVAPNRQKRQANAEDDVLKHILNRTNIYVWQNGTACFAVISNSSITRLEAKQKLAMRLEAEQDLANVVNGKIPLIDDTEETIKTSGINDFRQKFMKSTTATCAHPSFDTWSFCAKVSFYGLHGLKGEEDELHYFGKGKPTDRFLDIDAFNKHGFMHDMVLLLMDGCVTCNSSNGKNSNLTLTITQKTNDSATLLCDKENLQPTNNLPLTLKDGSAQFAYGVVLAERLCPIMHNGTWVMQPLKYKYEGLRLTITHECAGGAAKNTSIHIPTIDKFDKNSGFIFHHVMQIRHINLDLDNLKDGTTFDLSDNAKTKIGIGHYILPNLMTSKSRRRQSEAQKAENCHLSLFIIKFGFLRYSN